MKRREFIQLSSLGSLSTLLLNGNSVKAFSKTTYLNNIPDSIIDGRTLVMIQLNGGNDGLNTIIPLNQYDAYANLRPTIKIKNTGLNSAIELDSTLPLDQQILLHPSLTGFKELYDAGKLNIIHGVGYPSINKSHFAATSILLKGGDGTIANSNKTSGWMARYLNSNYDYTQYSDPLGIQLGSQKPSVGFESQHEHRIDINLTSQDISGFYDTVSNIGTPKPSSVPDTEYGENISFINNIESSTNSYSKRISEVFDAGSNSNVVYPNYDLANQLKTVAKMIKGGSKTKIFLVSIKGFDNHSGQVSSSQDSHLGIHADLLTTVGDSVKAFQDDLEALGIDEKVVTATFTEFGRKPIENGNLGTDHGNLGPMFVIGKHVNAGVSGTNLDLSNVSKHYDEVNLQHDYRQVFTTLIDDFLGASPSAIENTEFTDYSGDQKLNLIVDNQKSENNLAVDTILEETISFYPNPVYEGHCTIKYKSRETLRGFVVMYDLKGQLVFQMVQDFDYGMNVKTLNIEHLKEGVYILAIKDTNNKTLKTVKVVKR